MRRSRRFIKSLLIVASVLIASMLYAEQVSLLLEQAAEKARARDYSEAVGLYDQILGESPGNRAALLGKARVVSWMKEYDRARTLYREVLAEDPDNMEAVAGIADTYAWEKEYATALDLLGDALLQHPGERGLLVRMARFSLWAGDKEQALSYSEQLLELNPGDSDAGAIKDQARSLYRFEYYAGYSYLDINNNVDGDNVYAGMKYEPDKPYSLYGQIDYLNRFRQNDTRLLAGGAYDISDELALEAEVSLTGDADIYPRASGWVQLSSPVVPSLVVAGSAGVSHYRRVDLYAASISGEYFTYGNISLLVRYTSSRTEFDTGGTSDNDSLYLKGTKYFSDDNEFYVYYSSGNEAYKIDSIDLIGDIDADVYGLGGTWFITPEFGIAASFEYQDRENDTEYYQSGLEFKYRI